MTCCTPASHGETELEISGIEADDQALASLSRPLSDGTCQLEFAVPDAHCASCIRAIETELAALPMVETARVNLSRRRVRIKYDPKKGVPSALAPAIRRSGYVNHVIDPADDSHADPVLRELVRAMAVAGFAAGKPLAGPPGTVFNYSSGTAVLLARLWQDTLGEPQAALDWPREALFDPLGMESAVMETDASGTFVGSSYLYATARDWARFGLFMIGDGTIGGRRLVPEGFLDWMRQPASASNGEYGKGQLWLHGPEAGTPEGRHPDEGFDLPDDAVWALGHDGQSMAMIPSKGLVVLRMGLTPSKLGWKSQALVEAIVRALD